MRLSALLTLSLVCLSSLYADTINPRSGTTAQIANTIGVNGEIATDNQTKNIVIFDGKKKGGYYTGGSTVTIVNIYNTFTSTNTYNNTYTTQVTTNVYVTSNTYTTYLTTNVYNQNYTLLITTPTIGLVDHSLISSTGTLTHLQLESSLINKMSNPATSYLDMGGFGITNISTVTTNRIEGSSIAPGIATPIMTSYNTPSGKALSVQSERNYGGLDYQCFDQNSAVYGRTTHDGFWNNAGTCYVFDDATTIGSYGIDSTNYPESLSYLPKAWELYGTNDTVTSNPIGYSEYTWTLLNSASGVTWSSPGLKQYTISSPAAYKAYKIVFPATGNEGVGYYIDLPELYLYSGASISNIAIDAPRVIMTGRAEPAQGVKFADNTTLTSARSVYDIGIGVDTGTLRQDITDVKNSTYTVASIVISTNQITNYGVGTSPDLLSSSNTWTGTNYVMNKLMIGSLSAIGQWSTAFKNNYTFSCFDSDNNAVFNLYASSTAYVSGRRFEFLNKCALRGFSGDGTSSSQILWEINGDGHMGFGVTPYSSWLLAFKGTYAWSARTSGDVGVFEMYSDDKKMKLLNGCAIEGASDNGATITYNIGAGGFLGIGAAAYGTWRTRFKGEYIGQWEDSSGNAIFQVYGNLKKFDCESGANINGYSGVGTGLRFNLNGSTGDGYLYGKLGISTTTPLGKLDVQGSGTTTGVTARFCNSQGFTNFIINHNGNVGINTTTPSSKFEVHDGSITITGTDANLDVTGITKIRLPYGTFYSTTTQSIAVINTTQTITFNGAIDANGISLSTTNCMVPSLSGEYMVTFSAVPQGPNGNVLYIFPRINNVNVPYSNTIWKFAGTSAPKVMTVTFIFDLNAGDCLQLVMYGDNTGNQLLALPASTTPVAPAMPSIICTVNKLGEIQ